MLNIKVKIQEFNVERAIAKKTKRAQFALDEQVLKDSNYYIPADNWVLRNSGITASKIGKGRIIWDTPYARRLYWNWQLHFSKDKNPNARGKWFEYAKVVHIRDWLAIVQQEVDS